MSRDDAAATYLDPRDREYADSLSGDEREAVVATVTRFRRPERLHVGDPIPELDVLRLGDGEQVALASIVDGRPLVLVFGSFT